MQRQYELLTNAHNELLQRMESFMNQPPVFGSSGETADSLKIKLAAAHCLIEDLRRACSEHEGSSESLAKVRSFPKRTCRAGTSLKQHSLQWPAWGHAGTRGLQTGVQLTIQKAA